MSVGDWLVYYSPSTDFRGGKPLRAFTGIGKAVHRAVGEDWRDKGACRPLKTRTRLRFHPFDLPNPYA